MRSVSAAIAFIALALFTASAPADPTDAPTTKPAPYVFFMPSGMNQITVGDHTAIAPPQYEAMIRQALTKITATTRPTTTASDLAQRLANSRSLLQDQMLADLGIPKDKSAAFLDQTLKPQLDYMASLRPRVYVMVGTEAQINAVVRAGWHAPLFHYNKLADYTFFQSRVSVPDAPGSVLDDVVIWSEVTPGQTDAQIADGLVKNIHDFETGLTEGTTQGALLQIRSKLSDFLDTNFAKPLKLPSTEKWFTHGIIGAMSSKYMAPLTGFPRSVLAAAADTDASGNPLKSAPIDLMNEFDESVLKPGFAPYYLDAVGRKGTGVIQKLLDKSGDPILPKIIAAVKANPPPDNSALVAIIQSVTGVDITTDLQPPPI